MFAAVRSYLAEHAQVWDGLPANVAAHAELAAREAEIGALARAQGAALEGLTARKAGLRAALEEAILAVANPAAALAAATGDAPLLAASSFSATHLRRLSGQLIGPLAARLAAEAAPRLAALADYGVAAADLTALAQAAEAHNAALPSRDAAKARRTGDTAALRPLFAETSLLLTARLDKLMARYESTAPAFHAGYLAARSVIDLRGPSRDA